MIRRKLKLKIPPLQFWSQRVIIFLLGLGIGAAIFLIFFRVNDLLQLTNDKIIVFSDKIESKSDSIWIRISDSLHVYSAHYDKKERNSKKFGTLTKNLSLVRIIGIKRYGPPKSYEPLKWVGVKEEKRLRDDKGMEYECNLFVFDNLLLLSRVIPATLVTEEVIEEGIKRFASSFFKCYFNLTENNLLNFKSGSELYVYLSPKGVENYPEKLLRVNINVKRSHHKLGICVRPLFSPRDASIFPKLLQFISYYVAVGVSSFNFYELTISPQLRKYLVKYRKLGIVLKTWNLPTGNVSELWDFGSLAALNDCLYSNIGIVEHLIFVDLDEFIVPQRGENLMDIIEKYEPVPQLLIRNTFFCLEFCPWTTGVVNISSCISRTKRIWNVKLRAKFILRPSAVISVGHHTAHRFIGGSGKAQDHSLVVDPSIGLLNHYRECRSLLDENQKIFNRLITTDENIQKILKGNKYKLLL